MRVRSPPSSVLPQALLAKSHDQRPRHSSHALVEAAALDVAGVYASLATRLEGLTDGEAEARLGTSVESGAATAVVVATKQAPPREAAAAHATAYGKADECDLTLEGYVAFLDPPKETALTAIRALEGHGVRVKVITGDNELVARKVAEQVGLVVGQVLLGDAVEKMGEGELAAAAEQTVLFARVSPAHKQRIIKALRSRGHTVGFLGAGINDAPALHAADVGISVDQRADALHSLCRPLFVLGYVLRTQTVKAWLLRRRWI
jgi:cation transport ATPase